MNFSYNLIDEPWIPVLDPGGRLRQVGIRELLIHSHQYRQLAASLPQTNAALYRLLLAILHRVFGPASSEQWGELWQSQAFAAEALDTYLNQWHGRFDLFGPEFPFFQRQNPAVEIKPANVLVFMTGGGNPETLFDHAIDDVPKQFSPAQAALSLLTVQSFSLAGLCHPQLKLVYTDAPCSRAAVFLLQGKNLFENLMLNLVKYNRQAPIPWRGQDLPVWERDDPFAERTLPDGYLDYLTWPNRRVMLFPAEVEGEVRVTRVSMAPGLVLNAEQRNPMHHYRIDAAASAKQSPYKVLRFSEGRALWRDSSALLTSDKGKVERPIALNWAEELKFNELLPKRKLTLAAYGMSTDPGKQKVFFYRGDQFTFSDELLGSAELTACLERALDRAEGVRAQLWGAVSRLAGGLLSPQSDQKDARRADPNAVKQLIAHWDPESRYWLALEIPFYQFLDELPDHPDAAYADWVETLRKAGRDAFSQTAELAGTNAAALKAAASARVFLEFGFKKVLEANPQEEIQHA